MRCKAVILMASLVVAALVAGCAACPTCQGGEWHPLASPQGDPWKTPVPPAPAPSPRQDFATPPTDGPDVPAPPVTPPTPPVKPTTPPAPNPEPTVTTELVRRTSGAGVVIEQHGSGTVNVNSPGAPAAAPAAAPQFSPVAAYPIIPGPLSDAQYVGLARRIGGGIFYAVTGQCPAKPAPTVQVPVGTSTVQMVHYATVPAVPVTTYQVPAPAVAPMAPAPTPAYGYFPPSYYAPAAPQQAPIYASAQAPAAPRKSLCDRLRGR